MKKQIFNKAAVVWLTSVALLLLSVASVPASAQWRWGRPRPPSSGACFYRDVGFQGDFFCLKEGDRWPVLPRGFNDSVSSIRAFGGARLRIFYDNNFQGPSLLIDRDLGDLRRVPVGDRRGSWNDRISAIAVFRDRDEWAPRDRDRGYDRR